MASDISLLFKTKNIKVIENASLAHLSYMKSGGYALALVMPNSIEEMCVCIKLLYENGVKYKVLGRMSNTMSDSGTYNGVVVKTDKLNRKSEAENIVVAECGTRLCDIIWSCAKRGFGGAEGLFLIPASLGGAVYNNAGAHGFCISDLILECEIYLPREDKRLWVSLEKMGFGYRTSLFKNLSPFQR